MKLGQEASSPEPNQTQTSVLPADSAIKHTPPPDTNLSVSDGASAIASLLGEDGNFQEAAPEGQAESESQPEGEAPKAEPEKSDTPKEPQTLLLKIGEKEVTLPADSIPEELRDVVKDGLMMRADYTRKTMEVAQERQRAEAKAQEAMQAYQTVTVLSDHIAAVKSVDAQIQQLAQLDWKALAENDPIGEIKARQLYGELQQTKANLTNQISQAQSHMAQMQERQKNEMLQQALPKVKSAIPDFNQDKAQALREFAKSVGVSDDRLNNVYDAESLIILNMAYEYSKLKAEGAKAAKQVEKLPTKTLRSGVSEGPQDGPTLNQSAMARLYKSGKTEDAAAAIKSLLK